MYGFDDAIEATKAYLANYSKGWKGLGAITGVSREDFKEWINSSHRKTKPFRDYAMVKAELAKTDKDLYNIITDSKDSIVDFDAEYKSNLSQDSTITFYAIRENKKTGEKEYIGRNVGPHATVDFVIKEKDLQNNLDNGTYEKVESQDLQPENPKLQSIKKKVDEHLKKYRTLAPVEIISADTYDGDQPLKDYKEEIAFDPETKKIIIFADNLDEDYVEEGLFHESIHRGLQQYYGDGPIELAEAFWGTEGPNHPEKSKRQKEAIAKEYANNPESIKEEYFVHLLSHHMVTGAVDKILARLSPEHQEIVNNILYNIGYDTAEETKRRKSGEETTTGSSDISEKSEDRGRGLDLSSPTGKIEDVGEQIAGARKDLTRKIAQTIDSATKQTLAELPFSKAYKKPDLKKAVEEGALREDDATFYDAWFATMVNPTKPKVTQSEERSKRWNPSYRTKLERWVDNTYDALQVLKQFVEADEEERDNIIKNILEDKFHNREAKLADIEKRKEWNKDNKNLDWGDKTTPNPLWITYEVMKQLDYKPGDKLDIPYGIVEGNTSGTGIKKQGDIQGKDSGKPVNLEDYVADVDKNKPALDGVYHDPDGYAVVTDGYVLLADKQAYDKNHKGELLTLGKDAGKKKEGIYPDWKGIVNSITSDYKQAKINPSKLLDFLAGVESKLKEQWRQAKDAKETKMSFKDWSSYAEIFVKMPDGSVMSFRPQYLKLFAQGMKKIGANDIKYLNIYNNVQAQGKNGTALVMPLARFDTWSDDTDVKRFFYDLSEGKAETKRKLNHNDIISDIDEIDVPLQQKTRKSYTDREGVYHEGLEEELEHIGNSIRNRVDNRSWKRRTHCTNCKISLVISTTHITKFTIRNSITNSIIMIENKLTIIINTRIN